MQPSSSSSGMLRRRFSDASLERLYQSYSIKQRRDGLQCFIYAALVYDVYLFLVTESQEILTYIVTGVFLALNVGLLCWCLFGVARCSFWQAVPHLAWHVANAQLLIYLFLKRQEGTLKDSLGWALLLDYLIFVTLPLRLRYCLVLSVGTCASYLVAVIGLAKIADNTDFALQLATNCILLVAANLLGLMSYYLADKQQRRAFLETRQSLEMKLVIEEQSAEQERLLLSVLPEHVAVKMRQDLGACKDTQFKKIYMSRHENVSILYADIVGFTAISSTYSASELVKILNELFARFDRLSERYNQLRIKILGDCYYCISGAPRETPDHAVLCVYMGLSMVKAIKYVQQKTNSPVDMRVGIHTGAILAGVLGQRQWQFDVYSKDVELANKMESSGLPGRVHISEKTLGFLNGEFEVEQGYGERREEMLRLAGLKTFFIVKTLKPFRPSSKDVMNGTVSDDSIATPAEDKDKESLEVSSGDDDDKEEGSPVDMLDNGGTRKDSEDFKKRLREELINRDGQKDLSKQSKLLTLTFHDPNTEHEYQMHKEVFSSFSGFGLLVTLIFSSLAQIFILPRDIIHLMTTLVGTILLIIFNSLLIAEFYPTWHRSCVVKASTMINAKPWLRKTIACLSILTLGGAHLIDSFSCIQPPLKNNNLNNMTSSSETDLNEMEMFQSDNVCLHPSYLSHICVLVLVSASLPAQLAHFPKAELVGLIAIAQSAINIFLINTSLDSEWTNLSTRNHSISKLVIAIAIALERLSRYMEKVSRILFLWKTEVELQREQATDIRRRNEALVYNILPPHVASHFMGNRKRQHEELYSQSYAEVGVLFASMPNFTDFYSEESVNNQGLECLRFLNEVISDFDALLELPQFEDIIKIKTIGSTYMAASGLNQSRQVKPEDPIQVRWAHLALLVEFALELKKALQSINEQSFNHFVLKMGINHGPITAGVIGARKPHYDIWGNSVNVASRMESTGKAGCIQVTDETTFILKHFGYVFEQRGLVSVKGKGQLMTYYLIGKSNSPPVASPSVPMPPDDPIRETPSPVAIITEEIHDNPNPNGQPVGDILIPPSFHSEEKLRILNSNSPQHPKGTTAPEDISIVLEITK